MFLLLSLLVAAAFLQRASASAAVTTNISVPLNLTVAIPCANKGAGETVQLSGQLHILTTSTINGSTVHFSAHTQPQDVSGIGSSTGDRYRGTGVTRQDINFATSSFPVTFTAVNNFRIIGQGTSNNLLIHENAHFTVNANGITTATLDNFSAECK
jgi:hypothetical protein